MTEAEHRRRMRAGSEGASRFDHDRDRVGRCPFPGRTDPETADPDGVVKLPPALLPVIGHRRGGRPFEHLPQALFAAGVRVRRQFDVAVVLPLLESLGEELDHERTGALGPLRDDPDGDAAQDAQRKALFSFSKNPSSTR